MIYLVLSILFSTLIFVIFKYFDIYKINTLQAIVVNYIVAFTLGMFSANAFGKIPIIPQQSWFYGALLLGGLFVSVFFVMAQVLYKESITVFKIVGIILALMAVYLSSIKKKEENNPKAGFLLPVLLFFGSGIIDTTLKFVQDSYVSENEVSFFSGSLFGIAGILGILILVAKHILAKEKIAIKNIVAGFVLGIPNYYSIIFLIKALQIKSIESSSLFTINNVGVVVVSTLVGLFLFKEHFSTKNSIGIGLAILGIILVSIG